MTKITTLAQYVEQALEICRRWNKLTSTIHPWFRGQSDATWNLLPRLYRPKENPDYEREMVRDFKLRATAFLEKTPQNNIEWLFIMQHHGLPTRLLDWTESNMGALFFAVQNEEVNCDGAVWVLDPWSLNDTSDVGIGQTVPISNVSSYDKLFTVDIESRAINRTIQARYPAAVRPLRNTPRIVAQRGMFTIHGNEKISLDDYAKQSDKSSIKLDKILIDSNSKLRLKKELFLAGVSHSSLFPDLDGLSKEIHYRYSKNYMK